MHKQNYTKKHHIQHDEFRQDLLQWYDRHKRDLPWRRINDNKDLPLQYRAYCTWLSEIMLQQTVVKAVTPYFENFTTLWPTIDDLAQANEDDIMQRWAGLGYYSRARNLHKCAKYVSEQLNGCFPDAEAELINLPGIGPYTAAAITSIAFNKPAVVIDGNIDRIIIRLHAITTPIRDTKPLIRELANDFFFKKSVIKDERHSDFAQSLMDLGASICTPKSPKCMICPVSQHCKARDLNIQQDIPTPAQKKKKPQKTGIVYLIKDQKNRILIEKRPDKGLLASTIGLPSSDWVETKAPSHDYIMPFDLKNIGTIENIVKTNKEIRHVFTHFSLNLCITEISVTTKITKFDRYKFVPYEEFLDLGLPSLFDKIRKFYNQ